MFDVRFCHMPDTLVLFNESLFQNSCNIEEFSVRFQSFLISGSRLHLVLSSSFSFSGTIEWHSRIHYKRFEATMGEKSRQYGTLVATTPRSGKLMCKTLQTAGSRIQANRWSIWICERGVWKRGVVTKVFAKKSVNRYSYLLQITQVH